ncbi:MAG: hypothetical protein A2086_00280 [Spirochaetes bacterium GWD1_27_9]|nr:MAG: hypothetical protein A2Z98_09415 [Spirochaetes bacterium GWB1_27_13]OHD26862.1 MAG: hypothetical protein A2Y34_13605 [Spirochaetes bacterium GWC1_27_15]OHD43007.1 MAG: hypothetical protein A2086_00280 [Spirochaetes bacterium GWD1_27_9]
MNLNSILSYSTKQNPDKKALIIAKTGESLSYKELCDNIARYSTFFHKNNIKAGDRVAIKLKNSFEWIIIFYSLLNIGATPVLIDLHFTIRELLDCLQKSETDIIVVEETDKNLNLDSLNKCKKVFLFSDKEGDKNENIILLNNNNISQYKEEIKKYTGYSNIILFSYRGLGYPLVCLFNEKAILKSVLNNIYHTGLNSKMCTPLFLPSSHIFALTVNFLLPIAVGGTIIIMTSNIMPYDILTNFDKYKINFLIAVPTLIKTFLYLASKRKYEFSYLEKGIVGGSTFDKDLFYKWKDLTGSVLTHGFGLTETTPVICNRFHDCNPDTIGNRMPNTETKIIKSNGDIAKFNEEGTLFIKTRAMMECYLNKNEENKDFLKDGWFDTGDIVYMDEKEYFHFVRRDKDIGKIGGETVDLQEVKNILLSFDGIKEVKISTVPDYLFDAKIVADVVSEKNITKFDLFDYCKLNLASYKVPKEINVKVIT